MNLLLSKMLSHADPSQVAGLARFYKTGPGQYGEGDKFLGIKVPVTREVVKACWKEMVPADWQERAARGETPFPELEECVSSEYHEVRLAALLTLVEVFKHAKRLPGKIGVTKPLYQGVTASCAAQRSGTAPLSCTGTPSNTEVKVPSCQGASASSPATTGDLLRQQCIDFYLAHTQYINNWDLVDLSCYPLLGEWLLDKDRALLYELARNGRSIWEQRIGMVSTMTFIRHGQLDDTFAIADILLHHPHDLIQKAVGWLLREAGKRDKAALEAFLQKIPDQVGGDDVLPKGNGMPKGPVMHSPGVMPGCDDAFLTGGNEMPKDSVMHAPGIMPGCDDAFLPGGNGMSKGSVVHGPGIKPESDDACLPGGNEMPKDSVMHASGVMPGDDRASLPRYQSMPRTMLRYAIEKFPEAQRQHYLAK